MWRIFVERGFWKKQSPDKYIHRIDAIMRDPFYCGDIEYLPWEVSRRKGQHEGIISAEIFERIQRRLKNRGATARVRKDISDEFPLRGLVLCPHCTHVLTAANTVKKNGTKYPYYYCKNKVCEEYGTIMRRAEIERDFRLLLLRNRLKQDVSKVVQVVYDRVWIKRLESLSSRNGAPSVERTS